MTAVKTFTLTLSAADNGYGLPIDVRFEDRDGSLFLVMDYSEGITQACRVLPDNGRIFSGHGATAAESYENARWNQIAKTIRECPERSYKAIAAEHGVSYNTVINVALRFGLRRPVGKKLKPKETKTQ